MFELVQISTTFSDETAVYAVQLEKEYTVKEFVDTVLMRKYESGNIFIMNPRRKVCDYSHGRLVGCVDEAFFDKVIESVSGHGGWSNMDYMIKIKNDDCVNNKLKSAGGYLWKKI